MIQRKHDWEAPPKIVPKQAVVVIPRLKSGCVSDKSLKSVGSLEGERAYHKENGLNGSSIRESCGFHTWQRLQKHQSNTLSNVDRNGVVPAGLSVLPGLLSVAKASHCGAAVPNGD